VEVARQSEAQSLSFEDTETWGKLQKLGQAGQVPLSDKDSIHCVYSFLIVSHHLLILCWSNYFALLLPIQSFRQICALVSLVSHCKPIDSIYWYVAYDPPTRFTHHTAPPCFAQNLFLFPFLVRAWWRHWGVGWWYADWWEFASSKAWPILGFRPFQMLHLVKQIILSLLPDGFKIDLNSINRNLEPLMPHSKVSLPWWCHLAPAPNELCGSECKARWSLPSAVTKWNLHLHRNCES